MSRIKKFLPVTALLLFAMIMFLTAPAKYAKSVLDGVSLWAVNVLPATFPFLFLTAVLTALPPFSAFARRLSPLAGKLFGVSGAGGGAAILASLSGYPVGARLLCDLYEGGRLPKAEAPRLARLVTTSGPMFLVGTVGCMMYRSAAAGWILLLSHLIGVWSICLVLRAKSMPAPPPPAAPSDRNLLYNSLLNAVLSILCVGGFIALFSCFGEMLASLGLFELLSPLLGKTYSEGLCRGLLEMTTGCAVLAREFTPLSLALSCALVTFGGVCVLCQQGAYLSRAGVKIAPFLLVKLLQAGVSFFVCLALSALLLH